MSDIQIQQITKRYIIALCDGLLSITCHTCGMTSYHPQDVANRYCGHCKVFHADAGQWEALNELALDEKVRNAELSGWLAAGALVVTLIGVALLIWLVVRSLAP
jgi:hypothetical protein